MSATLTTAAKQKAKAAVLGALVSDAASLGQHWVYDQDALKQSLVDAGRLETPEFFTPQADKFYKHAPGTFSPYGTELLSLLKVLHSTPHADGNAQAKALAASYAAEAAAGRYINHSSKSLIANVAAGKSFPETGDDKDAQANAFVKAAAIVAVYAGTPQLSAKLEEAVRVQQNNDASVSAGVAGGLILEKVVLGHSIADAIQWALSEHGLAEGTKTLLQTALDAKDTAPYAVTAKKFGLSCGLPHSLQMSVLAGAKFPTYTEAVRSNIVAGGDNASRGVLIGALFAAQDGLDAVPAEWRAKTLEYAEAETLVDGILAQRA